MSYTVQLTPVDREQPCLYLCMNEGFKTYQHATDMLLVTAEQAEAICYALEYVDSSDYCYYNAVQV